MTYSNAYIYLTQMGVFISGLITLALIIYGINFLNVVVLSRITRSVFFLIISNVILLSLLCVGQFFLLRGVLDIFMDGNFGFTLAFPLLLCALGGVLALVVNVYLHFRRHRHSARAH